MIEDLSEKLCEITGYDVFSMQPNSGAQGEYRRSSHHPRLPQGPWRGSSQYCLIPASAHGTNPASATMCGFKVVVVGTDAHGNIDVEDFRAKAEANAANLAAAMITYPSTHGVFEETAREICEITHAYGGQVYLDGANMNALVGLARPGDFRGRCRPSEPSQDFRCIPHGGGGPGMGPIGVKAHLRSVSCRASRDRWQRHDSFGGAVRIREAFLAISWSYLLMMGGAGWIAQATRVAILSAQLYR